MSLQELGHMFQISSHPLVSKDCGLAASVAIGSCVKVLPFSEPVLFIATSGFKKRGLGLKLKVVFVLKSVLVNMRTGLTVYSLDC